MPNYIIAQLDTLPGVPCPCGTARRAFAGEGSPASVHVVDIRADAEMHYHKTHTEVYTILEGTGFVELDGDRVPVQPLTSIMILPGCRHRAVGRLRLLNVVIPPFDPADEFTDG